MIEDVLKKRFPKLKDDKAFKITSPEDIKYNCIAWAYLYKDRWMWPHPLAKSTLDGVFYWPDKATKTPELDSFIEAFALKGYEVCNNADFDPSYQKIAIYVKPGTTECTHASRQLRSGLWTSKLGPSFDVQHGTPYTIEGPDYGVVGCIMRREFK